MDIPHHYEVTVTWEGDRGTGTSGYRAYGREHAVTASGKPALAGSSDPAFRGDPARWNPEDLLLSSLAQCHMLSYLHVAVMHGVVVTGYTDAATGTMLATHDGGGHFTEVVLRPRVQVADASMVETAERIHHEAAEKCFIAASVNFPVRHEPATSVRAAG